MTHRTPNSWLQVEDRLFWNYNEGTSVVEKFPQTVPFQFVDFESGIDDDLRPDMKELSPVGRPTPFVFYMGARNREIKLNCVFVDEEYPGEALEYARFLLALVRPWNRAFAEEAYLLQMYPPPKCVLFIGSADVLVRGFVKSVDVTYMTPLTDASNADSADLPFAVSRSLVPGQIQCSFSFIVDDTAENYDGINYMMGANDA